MISTRLLIRSTLTVNKSLGGGQKLQRFVTVDYVISVVTGVDLVAGIVEVGSCI